MIFSKLKIQILYYINSLQPITGGSMSYKVNAMVTADLVLQAAMVSADIVFA